MAVRDTASLLAGLALLCHTWGAWAAVEVNMEDRVEVFRGDTAQITCMFKSDDGIGGMNITWLYTTWLGDKQKIYTQDMTVKIVERGTPFTDRISVNGSGREVVLTISDVRLADELEFICSIHSLTDGNAEGHTKLKVFETPKPPTIEGVQTGFSVHDSSPVKIGVCEVKNGYPKPNITWYRNTTPLQNGKEGVKVTPSTTTESSGLFSVTSELSIPVKKEDKDAEFYCEVNYFVPGGTRMMETDRININVYYPSTSVRVWVESPEGKIKEGDAVKFRCEGDGNSPSSVFTIKHGDMEYSVESNMLVLHNVTRLDSGVYNCTCLDTETYDEITGHTTVSVHYLDSAVVIPKDTAVVEKGKDLTATCNALSSLQTQTVWLKNEEVVSRGHTLTLKDTTFDTAGAFVCVVTVPEIEGMETSGKLHVAVKGSPEILRPQNTEIEEYFEKSVNLSCQVRSFPAPDITWTTSDGKVLQATSQTEAEHGVWSTVSVKVTADITAFCNATNEYGTDGLAYSIKSTIHTTHATTTINTSIPSTTVKAQPEDRNKLKKESSGVLIAVLIICILLLAILGSVLYFLYKKGKICGRSGKQDLCVQDDTKEKSKKDSIVVEMKSDNTEEAILLGVNGEKQLPSDQ